MRSRTRATTPTALEDFRLTGSAYDEFQDMLYDAVVPVMNACMKNSNFRFETYAGTPKTMEASIQYLWEKSTQSEWVMKCTGCSKYNIVDLGESLGRSGPICLHCGKGTWIRGRFLAGHDQARDRFEDRGNR
jgi:hypothetical protein